MKNLQYFCWEIKKHTAYEKLDLQLISKIPVFNIEKL